MLEEAREKGRPIYVPGGAIKGWEYQGDLVKNPDFVAPEPVVAPQPKHFCADCKVEMDNKGKAFMRGLTVFYVCVNCIKKYGGL